MGSHNRLLDQVYERNVNATAAGTTNINGSSIDMEGFESAQFIALLGALTATQVTKLKVQGSDDNSTWADLTPSAETAAAADGDSNKMLIVEVVRPQHRYLRPVLERGTANAAVDGVMSIKYAARKQPTTQPTGSVSQTKQTYGSA